MIGKKRGLICVSLTEQEIKIVQLSGSGPSAKITHLLSRDVQGLSEADLSKTIHSSLSGLAVRSSDVVCLIPPSMVTTKNIEIPSTSPEEIHSIVGLQAGRHTPFSREEIQTGYINLGVYKTNYTKVLLVISNKGMLKNHLQVLEKNGLKIKKVLFAPEGMAQFYTGVLNLFGDSVPSGVIDMGSHSTEFLIIFRGLPITSRRIAIGRSHLTAEGQPAKNRLADELKKTLESYISEDIEQTPAQYILTQDDELNKEMQSILKDSLNWNVVITPYLDSVKATQGVLKKIATDFAELSFLDVISSAMHDNAQVDLVPEEIEQQKTVQDQRKEFIKLAAVSFVTMVFLVSVLLVKIFVHESILKNLRNEYTKERTQFEELEKYQLSTRIMENFFRNRMTSLDVVNELYKKVPNEVYLKTVNMEDSGVVKIEGIADTPEIIFKLSTALKESELFKSVEITGQTSKKDRGKNVSSFEMTMSLHPVEKEKEKVKEAEKQPKAQE